MDLTADLRPLVGRDNGRTKLWLFAAVGLFLVSSIYWAVVRETGRTGFQKSLGWTGHAVLLVVIVAFQAYSNDGLLVSWALAFAAVAATVLEVAPTGRGAAGPPDPLVVVGLAVIGGAFGATVLGTTGYLVGILLKGAPRRVRRSF